MGKYHVHTKPCEAGECTSGMYFHGSEGLAVERATILSANAILASVVPSLRTELTPKLAGCVCEVHHACKPSQQQWTAFNYLA